MKILTVTRLGTLPAAMAHLIAVAALDIGHVLGLRAFLGQMLFRTTVAATTRTGRMGWAILGKVTNYTNRTSVRQT
jgi:hypothetical protein